MFGEKPLLGIYNCTIDDKRRIVLPSKTFREPGDDLSFICENPNYFSLYKTETFINMINEINKRLKEANTEEMVKLLKKEKDILLLNFDSRVKIDNQGRILISQNISDTYLLEDKVCILGAYDHINIFKNEEEFKAYKKSFTLNLNK